MESEYEPSTSARTLAGELSQRTNKSERVDPQLQLTLLSKIKNLAKINKTPYENIQGGADILNETELDPETAVSNYCNIRNARHDIWYDMIYTNLCWRWDTNGRESTFGAFVEKVLKVHVEDNKFKNKRPDILLYDDSTNEVVIGDITITAFQQGAISRKHEKYDPLVQMLMELQFNVCHIDFVLREDLQNMGTQVNIFKRKNIIHRNTETTIHQDYTVHATNLMYHIKRMCNNLRAFNSILDKDNSEIADSIRNFSLLEGLLDERVIDYKLEPYIPKLREEELIKMIKNRVEHLGGASYFNSGAKDVELAFDKVVDNNKKHIIMQPKSVLKVIDNSHSYNRTTGLDLIEKFVCDIASGPSDNVKDYILDLLPTLSQLKLMKIIRDKKMTRDQIKDDEDMRTHRVGGQYQYMRKTTGDNPITQHLEIALQKGKNKPNDKKEPAIIDIDNLEYYGSFIDSSIKYYGSPSNKPPFLDDSWDAYNKVEEENTKVEREIYNYCRSTNGAQMTNSLSALFQRLTHMSAKSGTYDNIFIPANGSFICIMPKNHAPVNRRTCDMPFIFLTRSELGDPLSHIEHEHKYYTTGMNYYVSKLCRLSVSKIACWDNAGHRLVASATYLISKCPALRDHKERVVGLLTYLITDVHQKVSEYLDLLKYISFMPFADLHLLPKLIVDKCDLLMKTRLDAWMFRQIRNYIRELSNIEKLEARKPIIQLQNGLVINDSLGITLRLPSFFSLSTRHNDPTEFIEEIGMLFTSRPKHLYGSQFLDESTTMTAKWDVEYDEEIEKYGNWATKGVGEGVFPFNSKFCYSSDAIHYATLILEKNVDANPARLESHLFKGNYGDFLHMNCSLRGCTKSHSERSNQRDMHTTSIDACLKLYKELKFVDKDCRAISIGQSFALSDDKMEFSMSEKDQRGGGRPIATPTLGTKAALMLIEKPEATIGSFMLNNILVAGKSKIKEQHRTYTSTISHGASLNFKEVYQLTEDQTKYSENDNPRKFEAYLRTSTLFKPQIRKLQMIALNKLYDRNHLIHDYPREIKDNPVLVRKTFTDNRTKCVNTKIGWPQGMLNNISTTIHSAADLWILGAFKRAYPNIRIYAQGLVHSDDSWVTVCTNSLNDFKLFTLFRMTAKKMFCLKLNEKKLWAGRYLGELVSNYNLNGKVHLATSKIISNGLSNLTYQNWPIDVSSQISTIQQTYRSGANIATLITMATILRQQIIGAYQITGKQLEYLHVLPIELGGYPKCSVFKLGVGGVNAMYDELAELYSQGQFEEARLITLAAAAATRISRNLYPKDANHDENDDFAEVIMPSRGEVFKGIKFLMPKSTKVKTALKTINEITKDFESDGLGMIVTRPLTLAESLGHLRDNTAGNMYKLAAEKYTQSVRRLAISQAQQSSGKVVKVNNGTPCTLNEMYELLKTMKVEGVDEQMVHEALVPESEIVWACTSIVNTAVLMPDNHLRKGNVINRMPEFETIYDTISPISDVLLYIIDTSMPAQTGRRQQSLYDKYGSNKTSQKTLHTDAANIKERFGKYFRFYTTTKACSIVMQNKINAIKERTWVQPKIESSTMSEFLEGLYGVTLNSTCRYKIYSNREYNKTKQFDSNVVKTLYSTEVVNRVYEGKFEIQSIMNQDKLEALRAVDQSKLDKNDSLKYAILMHEWDDNKDYLINIFDSDKFIYKWEQAQRYVNGRYQGDWKIRFMLGKLTGQIRHINGRTTIKVNTMTMYLLLKAMRIIAERCFSKMYEYDTAWWLCPLWNNTAPPMESSYYLRYISHFETIINSDQSEKSISIELSPDLRMGEMASVETPTDFYIDKVLRTVKVQFNNVKDPKTAHRMGRVFQDLTIPMRSEVMLEPAIIQGFYNIKLYVNGIMEDLMLSRHISAAKKTIWSIIESCGHVNKVVPIWNVMYQLHAKLKRRVVRVNVEDQPEVATMDEDIETSLVMMDEHRKFAETAEVETLEATFLQYETIRIDGERKVVKVPNIMRALCSQYWGDITEKNKHDLIYRLIHDPNIIKIRDEVDVIEFDETNDAILEDPRGLPSDLVAYSFIIGADIEHPRFWLTVNRAAMSRISDESAKFYGEDAVIEGFTNTILELFSVDKQPKQRSQLDYLE